MSFSCRNKKTFPKYFLKDSLAQLCWIERGVTSLTGSASFKSVAKPPLTGKGTDKVHLCSDFAGMDMPAFALRKLGLTHSHEAWETGRVARAFIRTHHRNADLNGDVWGRRPVDDDQGAQTLLTAGFPCQPFSTLGRRKGWDDSKERGQVVLATIERIRITSPAVFLLENVAAFKNLHGGRVFKWLLRTLSVGGQYELHSQVCCTSEHGLPHRRKRWYLVGLRRSLLVAQARFSFPEPLETVPLRSLLGPDTSADPQRLPPCSRTSARANVERELKRLRAAKVRLQGAELCMQPGRSAKRCHPAQDLCPCLLHSDRAGPWNLSRGEYLGAAACSRLQGLPAADITGGTSDGEAIGLLGNAMSLNVVERLLGRALAAVGLLPQVWVDRWANGSAQAELIREAWGDVPLKSWDFALPGHVRDALERSPCLASRARPPASLLRDA